VSSSERGERDWGGQWSVGDGAGAAPEGGAGSAAEAGSAESGGTVRLQKALAHAGVASRRACESLISGGRVTVNGETVFELGSRIDPASDTVRVDGVVVQLDTAKRYFVLNKPRGVVSTMRDEQGRPDLREFVEAIGERVYNVGRLDTDTSGLLVLTNDGEVAHRLAHPSFGVQKTYIAKVRGRVTPAVIQRLKDGVDLDDGPIRADAAKLLPGGSGRGSLVEVTLHSGRNRIVRRMLAEVGHPVQELVRRSFGPLHLGTLRLGEVRELSAAELGALLSAAEDGVEASAGITAGRPGDGKGARGMRGVAARGNPHGRR
jgi:23S rRNA pseudouridine2605 synthase/16S rRNA pseudouridine516 synthase